MMVSYGGLKKAWAHKPDFRGLFKKASSGHDLLGASMLASCTVHCHVTSHPIHCPTIGVTSHHLIQHSAVSYITGKVPDKPLAQHLTCADSAAPLKENHCIHA